MSESSELNYLLCLEADMTTKKHGMYAVEDADFPKVKVGQFTICRQDDKSVWIQKDDGEGGQFSDADFEEMIRGFYEDNF